MAKTKTRKITMTERKVAAMIPCPEGWTKEVAEYLYFEKDGKAFNWGPHSFDAISVRLSSPDIVLVFRVTRDNYYGKQPKPIKRVSFDGTTYFKKDSYWLNFDRTGVESSFHSPYQKEDPTLEQIQQIIDQQIKRVKDYLEMDAKRINIPGLPFRVSPEKLEEYKASLKAGRSISFTPSGFGTGYRLTTRKVNHPYCDVGTQAQKDFFGVDQLWIKTFDCD